MRLISGIALSAAMFMFSSSSFAFFDVEGMVGKRWYKFESTGSTTTNVASQEVDLAVHLDPIPLVPVAFGVGLLSGDLNKDDFASGVTEAKVIEADIEVKAWLSMVPFVTPYVRIKVPAYARLAVKGKTELDSTLPGEEDYAYVYKLSGYHANVGILYPIIPLVRVTLEAGKGMQTTEIDEYKVASTKQSTSGFKKENANSDTFLVGVQVGF